MEFMIKLAEKEVDTDLAIANAMCNLIQKRVENRYVDRENISENYNKSIKTIAYSMLATVDDIKFETKEIKNDRY